MAVFNQKITIIRIRRPAKKEINSELQWLGDSLGLFGIRDRNKSCFRIFIELLKSSRAHKPMTSDEIAYKLKLSRGTVVHHLNMLIESGIVVPEKNRYLLRTDNLQSTVEEIRKDIERTLEDMKHMAKEIDDNLGL